MFASAWSTRWATQVTIPSSVWLSDLTGILWSGLGLILRAAADGRTWQTDLPVLDHDDDDDDGG